MLKDPNGEYILQFVQVEKISRDIQLNLLINFSKKKNSRKEGKWNKIKLLTTIGFNEDLKFSDNIKGFKCSKNISWAPKSTNFSYNWLKSKSFWKKK